MLAQSGQLTELLRSMVLRTDELRSRPSDTTISSNMPGAVELLRDQPAQESVITEAIIRDCIQVQSLPPA